MVLWIVRAAFLIAVVGTAASLTQPLTEKLNFENPVFALIPYGFFFLMLGLVAAVIYIDMRTTNKQITMLSAVYFGLLLGLLFSNLISTAVQPLFSEKWLWLLHPVQLLLTIFFCYICVSTLVQTKDDFRLIIPYVEFSKQLKGGRPLVLDTSVIIDGRIADICDTRILDNKLVVPRFVLQELQSVADSADKLKRNRGRRGMDMLKRMQNNPNVDLEVHEANFAELQGVREVDQRLVIFAKLVGGRVMTNDFNLNKAAQLQGVEVINLNELANAMKSVALPGETMMVRLIKAGDQIGQGVGYLDDGTMIVAEQGRNYIGQDVTLTVTSVLQTPAGRMIFGRVEGKVMATPAPVGDKT